MFSSALKSFTSNITSNYIISAQPTTSSGPWKIFDAKRKSTGKAASVFVFDRKSLEPSGASLGGRSSAAAVKRVHEEVLERLKKEASALARLRHPSVLELAEPVEETRTGLMFATEAVSASLASLLSEKDEQERGGGVGGRGSRFVVEEADGTKRRRELEIDELEIQKGLLQLGKGLEFLHESAGLVHANLTPEAVLVNAKGDWKISGLAFAGPHESSTAATSLTAISLSEVLNLDPRLPRSVQLNLDYTSPDFVLDNSLTASADIFSLGLIIIALYNSPHTSPLSTNGSLSAYKRLFSSSSNVPTQNNNFLVPSSHPLPPKLASELLPRLITRRPAQRLSAKEFQQASYFDNILVSTIRFLDALPAKTPNEKAQFLRGLPRIMPQFPKTVLEKKVLPALLEETKDRELLAPILSNVFAMIKGMPNGKRAFTDQVVPKLKEVFVMSKATSERDTSREAGLMVLLENMNVAAENCSGKEFREDLLPVILLALESPTHALVDAALSTLPSVLTVLDFSTIKNDLFPVIANVFAKTSSLNIKIRGLEAFYTLIGGSSSGSSTTDNDDINGFSTTTKRATNTSSAAILDKFTIQEKIVPLLKAIKTKEPGVMMAALKVFRQLGDIVDTDFLAMDVLPTLWSMSLGPLLNLDQFQEFMTLIKGLGGRIQREQVKKLRELGSGGGSSSVGAGLASRRQTGGASTGLNGMEGEADFETLVSGRKAGANGNGDLMNDWAAPARPTNNVRSQSHQDQPMFSWQSGNHNASMAQPQPSSMSSLRATGQSSSRAITPDQTLSSFAALAPSSTQWSQPLQPQSHNSTIPMRPAQQQQKSFTSPAASNSIDWSAATQQRSFPPPPQSQSSANSFGSTSRPAANAYSSFTLSPPPTSPQAVGAFSAPPSRPPNSGTFAGTQQPQQSQQPQKSGLDRYESLL
ncbi:Protein kinase domain-containing protein ppk32 [Saxophila tyrrhenica]|uniref:Protein kinase domain-containing protein ppk32 n=1 Tax=Saxophila tyrrhenica TaxID=1690608 RepID=A0AAV9P8S8_9PEZI|nr:Protein kinase domain-containing protein ppk32 [Saxophila tyrrhenica]